MADNVESEPQRQRVASASVDPALPSPGPGGDRTIGSRWCRHRQASCPPPAGCRRVYIPIYGYFDADDGHRARVDRFFHVPMLVLALLVLPIVVYEFVPPGRYPAFVRPMLAHPAMAVAVDAAMAFIWLAFLVEFVVKITIAPSRAAYAAKNWLDIVIILLPMLRVLRGARALRGIRALRGVRAFEATKLTRLSRVFTLRGVAMKSLRTVAAMIVGMQVVRRLRGQSKKDAPKPATAPDYTQWSQAALIAEIRRLTARIRALEGNRTVEGRDTHNGAPWPSEWDARP